jgi:hypothetical protein
MANSGKRDAQVRPVSLFAATPRMTGGRERARGLAAAERNAAPQDLFLIALALS